MPQMLPAIVIDTAARPTHAVIWLHGLGADGGDFAPIVPHLGLPPELAVRFVFPHAPAIPVTCNGGYVMPAWYDITYLDGSRREVDLAGILASRTAIRALIAELNRQGIATARIVLAGFSQGGALAYSAGLTHPEKLAGIVALSAYIPAPGLLAGDALAANRDTPLFAAHGSDDDVVAPPLGRRACELLRAENYRIDWHEYPMAHEVCPEEIADIGRWLARRFAADD